ncbi:MAG: hypothetical protein K1X83_07290 [Oligoflexia bacterium]|nr:hypothetical protein [Oligoflexia bacterium]
MDWIALVALRALINTLNTFPLDRRLRIVASIIRGVARVVPRFRKVALRNLEIALPEISPAERLVILEQSIESLARVFVDFARLALIDQAWIDQHVICPFLPRFEELKREHPEKGVLIATGHLGSFELVAHCAAIWGYPLSFIVRDFKLKRLDKWWRSIREAHGNRVISRKGAMRDVIRDLNLGRDVAILFDQNLTRKHAEFVDWFGVPAATTRAVGLAAVRTKAIVIVASIAAQPGEKYLVNMVECNFDSLYQDAALSPEAKIRRITQLCSLEYEKMIRKDPGQWFWMHRRWRTRPDPKAPSIY